MFCVSAHSVEKYCDENKAKQTRKYRADDLKDKGQIPLLQKFAPKGEKRKKNKAFSTFVTHGLKIIRGVLVRENFSWKYPKFWRNYLPKFLGCSG